MPSKEKYKNLIKKPRSAFRADGVNSAADLCSRRSISRGLIELSLISCSQKQGVSEILRDILTRQGFERKDIAESSLTGGRSKVSVYVKSRARSRSIRKSLLNLKLKDIVLQARNLQTKDWRDKWKTWFRPFQLTEEIDIVPLWKKKTYRSKERKPLFLKSVNAFGTGLHETTRLSALFIRRMRGRFTTFFDIGTGTGILSLVALQYGAKEIYAIDIDEAAVEAAVVNLKVNRCRFDEIVVADIGKFQCKKKFDLVAANLITHDLIKFKKKILSFVRPQKYLAVSGISTENLKMLQKALKAMPLECLNVKKGKKWAALLFKRV